MNESPSLPTSQPPDQELLSEFVRRRDELARLEGLHEYLRRSQVAAYLEATNSLADRLDSAKLTHHWSKTEVNIGRYLGSRKTLAGRRELLNKRYIDKRLNDPEVVSFFQQLTPVPTREQRIAILTADDQTIVEAAAGCGKTTTILAKCRYLLDIDGIDPSQIKVLCFNTEVKEKLRQELPSGVEGHSFHSFFRRVQGLYGEAKKWKLLSQLIILPEESPLRQEITEFIALYAYDLPENSLSEAELETFLSSTQTRLETLTGEYVRSVQEWRIANWLTVHGLDYRYEEDYFARDLGRSIHPDFYLPKHSIYIEHWAVSADGSSPFGGKYLDDMQKKRTRYHADRVDLIETTSAMFSDDSVYSVLEAGLSDRGISTEAVPWSEIWHKYIKDRVLLERFAEMVTRLYGLLAVLGCDDYMDSIRNLPCADRRARLFVDLAAKIIGERREVLKRNQWIDFVDMINLRDGGAGHFPTLHTLIVDEAQDLWKLVTDSLVRNTSADGAGLWMVGDCRQAIYGWAGFNKCILSNSAHGLLPTPQRVPLAESFRFSQAHAEWSDRQNTVALGERTSPTLSRVKRSTYTLLVQHDKLSADDIIDELLELRERHASLRASEVLFLTRYKRSKCAIKKKRPKGTVKTATIHTMKGAEHDIVVIADLIDSVVGFPNKLPPDSIFEPLMDREKNERRDEEAELFYVAITRAKRLLLLLAPTSGYSSYVGDILKDNSGHVKCWSELSAKAGITPRESLRGFLERSGEEN